MNLIQIGNFWMMKFREILSKKHEISRRSFWTKKELCRNVIVLENDPNKNNK